MKLEKTLFSKFPLIAAISFLLFLGVTPSVSAALLYQDMQEQENSFNQYQGKIIDSETKNPLVFATLSIDNTNISTVSNTEGYFSLKVPKDISEGQVSVSFLGYETRTIPLSQLKENKNEIELTVSFMELSEVSLAVPKDAKALVKETLLRKGENYFDDPTLMTAFYRETIKKRRKNVSLSEAVVNIYKSPYNSDRRDALQLYKARKSTDYDKLDTLAIKLQGGPFNTLFVDMIKYPQYIFTEETFDDYNFSFENSTKVNDKLIFVINFKQKESITDPLYQGKLYIDADKKILTSAIYSLNITDRDKAAKMFVRKKPAHANVWPTDIAYRVDYREKNGKWYYGYSNVLLEFKINWDDRLFNSVYSMTCEMAITDWEKNTTGESPKFKDRIKSSIILEDEAIGFSDPDFWGEYNIIEPEKSIESAIKKIQRQLRRSKSKEDSSSLGM
ncbi:CarboxypepD_reg-like domain-containing protein [Arenibacter palladensis]|uniref:CarboxypepD_reg-like domain-containing protein n=1 Tax=Arenibacter palladensis TaxID=237373 RepID=A0A1M5BNY5_9FLAO|nr:carboxypeptidase-like regulatory domain-containing protein [Arenibacter palladensis]MDO6603356.1 carboxypeptidase-like regulatory domain-containing protein [Arenibacter palladensis]SHF44333.1 CarboxypepD_reg-like domain-containing protein [Arenibacter palladensis]|tara:strand:- start:4706 stop:6043 length:1338 start_codon:yes stop_codon:yes gene_type:complete